jgi:hypothetical protein
MHTKFSGDIVYSVLNLAETMTRINEVEKMVSDFITVQVQPQYAKPTHSREKPHRMQSFRMIGGECHKSLIKDFHNWSYQLAST